MNLLNPVNFLLGFFGPLLFILVVGTTLLFLGFKVAKLPAPTYQQSWAAFLIAVPAGYVLFIPVTRSLPWSNMAFLTRLWVETAVVTVAEIIIVPLVLRKFTWKALMVQEIAVVLTNVILVTGVWLLSQK